MATVLPHQPARIFASRRARLRTALGAGPAIVFAGLPRPTFGRGILPAVRIAAI